MASALNNSIGVECGASSPLLEDHHEDYSFAEIYTGLPPEIIPKAVALDDLDLFLNRMCLDRQGRPGSTIAHGTCKVSPDKCPLESRNPGQEISGSDSASCFNPDAGEILLCIEENDHISTTTTDVLFSEPKSSSGSSSNDPSYESEIRNGNITNHGKKIRKGNCHRCLKGRRTQDKESCLVCNAKYCVACIVDAMGSMPEGRKCLRCLGKPVAESRMPSVGKPSKLLCRLLTTQEIQLIMKAERECPTNQLRAEQVWVNGAQLTMKEFMKLRGCENPPSRLKPGKYWYDASSGYWGKIGHKPEEIITFDLKVGGLLHAKASNGNTKVYVNEREITKIELKMLQLAGIPCPPNTSLWLDKEGNCTSEGHMKCIGNIWNKGSTKLLSSLFSLPTPNNRSSQSQLRPAFLDQNKMFRILLLGDPDSGTGVIFKQVRLLLGEKLTRKERQAFKLAIQSCLFRYMTILLEACERFCDAETPSTSTVSSSNKSLFGRRNKYSMDDRVKKEAVWFLDKMEKDNLEQTLPAASQEYARVLEEIWKDPAIQATYERRNELLMLPDVAAYFLDRMVEMLSNEYEPSDMDILFAETVTDSPCISEVEFSQFENFFTSGPYTETLEKPFTEARYCLINVTGDITSSGFRLFRMFDNVDALIFCVALDAYDQIWSTDLKNKMILNRELFETVVKHPNFQKIPIILFLNKFDSLEEKIQNVPLNRCQWFSDFNPVRSSQQSLAQDAYTYIAHKFKKHFEAVSSGGSRLFTFEIKTFEQSSVKAALQYVREILKWEGSKSTLCSRQLDSLYTTGSTETTNNSSLSNARGH